MAQYAPEFLASLKHRYEKTDQPMIELAREFGIGLTTLQVLADKQGWEKRSQRLRGIPAAMRLEREAAALAAGLPSPRTERARSDAVACAASEGGRDMAANEIASQQEPPTPDPSPPLAALAGGGEQTAGAGGGEPTAFAGGGEPAAVSTRAEQSPVERLQALVVQEIADLESARDLRGGKRVSGAGAERTAQALASLTRTLQTIRRMRGEPEAPEQPERTHQNIDERRLLLAARIREFVRSRQQEIAADAAAPGEAESPNYPNLEVTPPAR